MQWTQITASWPISAKPDAVYAALTSSESLRQWFAEYAEVDARVGGAYRFWGRHTPGSPTAADATQRITALTPNETLAFTWRIMGVDSTVALTIAEKEQGTTLTAEHSFSGPLGIERQREFIDDFWRLSYANLMLHVGGMSGLTRPDFADPAPAINQSVLIDAPRDVVYRVLTEPDLINQWTGSSKAAVNLDAGTYVFGWQYEHEGKQVQGGPTRILSVVPNERLEVDWADWRGDDTVTGQRLVFALSDSGESTQLDFTHTGFTRAADISDYGYGWIHFLSEIRRVAQSRDEAQPTP